MADTREQLIEQMARAKSPHLWGDFAAQLAKLSIFTPEQAEASAAKKRAEAMIDAGLMLPVVVRHVTDRVRAAANLNAISCHAAPGEYGPERPWLDLLALLDEIDAEMGGEHA